MKDTQIDRLKEALIEECGNIEDTVLMKMNSGQDHFSARIPQTQREVVGKTFSAHAFTSPRCVREFDRYDAKMLRGFFRGVRRQLTQWGADCWQDAVLAYMLDQAEDTDLDYLSLASKIACDRALGDVGSLAGLTGLFGEVGRNPRNRGLEITGASFTAYPWHFDEEKKRVYDWEITPGADGRLTIRPNPAYYEAPFELVPFLAKNALSWRGRPLTMQFDQEGIENNKHGDLFRFVLTSEVTIVENDSKGAKSFFVRRGDLSNPFIIERK